MLTFTTDEPITRTTEYPDDLIVHVATCAGVRATWADGENCVNVHINGELITISRTHLPALAALTALLA